MSVVLCHSWWYWATEVVSPLIAETWHWLTIWLLSVYKCIYSEYTHLSFLFPICHVYQYTAILKIKIIYTLFTVILFNISFFTEQGHKVLYKSKIIRNKTTKTICRTGSYLLGFSSTLVILRHLCFSATNKHCRCKTGAR